MQVVPKKNANEQETLLALARMQHQMNFKRFSNSDCVRSVETHGVLALGRNSSGELKDF